MKENKRSYIAIDLKSFYASVECVERGLDPLRTNLVVADLSRTEKTICLAVSPSLKAYGVSGRARLFEVVEKVKEINALRRSAAPGRKLEGSSFHDPDLKNDPSLALDYIVAVPRMAYYMEYSARIVSIYLKYVSIEDLHVYSIDEVFIDATDYLNTYGLSARQLAEKMIGEVLGETGITATAGIGSNMYLAKIAMDIVAKHTEPDENGVRIAELDERSYREKLWDHRPISDFWRVGSGISRKLASHGIYTMGDVARCSVGRRGDFHSEELLYRLFGVNAELLIDHAWGWEPCTMKDIKSYRTENNSLSSGQVLHEPYSFDDARLVVWEMSDLLALDLVSKGLDTDQMVLSIGYDRGNLEDPEKRRRYKGAVAVDYYGRAIPKHAHGSRNLGCRTSSSELICDAVMKIYDSVVDPDLTIRRMYVVANHVRPEGEAAAEAAEEGEQLDIFALAAEQGSRAEASDAGRAACEVSASGAGQTACPGNASCAGYAAGEGNAANAAYREAPADARDVDALTPLRDPEGEKRIQEAMLEIKERYGKNAILKGSNLLERATARDRNEQIGGHRR